MRHLSIAQKTNRRKVKKHRQKHGHSPCRPRAITYLDALPLLIFAIEISLIDMLSLISGKPITTHKRKMPFTVHGSMLFPIPLQKQKPILFESYVSTKLSEVGAYIVFSALCHDLPSCRKNNSHEQ